ncbi:hypothetical protein ES703_77481 [subsurface metagenome]
MSNRLQIGEIAPPVIPIPPPPVVPEPPTIDILGTPSLNLPNQVNVGDIWSGSVSLPTVAPTPDPVEPPVPLFIEARLLLQDPTRVEYRVAQGGRTLQLGETLEVPVSYDTSGFAGGDYTILLRVFDQLGNQIVQFPMGFLSMIEAIVLVPPEVPTLPTADMFGTPSINLPTQVEIGELWQGNISIPTYVPPALQALPSLPSFPVNIGLQLQNPAGQLFNVGTFQPTFTPGQPIDLPMNFDTSVLPQEGMHNLIMNITDLQGNTLFPPPGISGIIGMLQAMMPAIPPIPPLPPELSEFPSIAVNLGTSQVEVDGTLSIPITYTHVGAPETVILYAAIGDDRPWYLGGLDEVWHAQKTISVPLDVAPTPRQDSIDIPITPKIGAAGIYSVYAKIMGRGLPFRDVISPTLRNIVEVLGPPAIPEPPLPPAISRFTSIVVNISPQQVEAGDQLVVPVSITHVGAAESVTLYAAIGNYGRFGFDEVLHASKRISVPQDASPTSRGDEVVIPITTALRPGYYDVYAKITGKYPETVSEPVQNVIELVAPPEVPPSQFPSCSVSVSRQRLKEGDTLTVPVRFVHIGQRERIRIYAAIGNYGAYGFDEVLHGSTDWATPDDMTPQTRTVDIPISITAAISPGTYDVYGKVMRVQTGRGETISDPVQNVIEIYAPVAVGPSQFYNVSVSRGPFYVRRGSIMAVRVSFTHLGEAESEWLYAAIGTVGAFGFDEILSNKKAIAVNADLTPKVYDEFVQILITEAIKPGTYDLYAKIGLGVRPKAISPPVENVVFVRE